MLTDTLKLTAGVRVSKDSFTIESLSGGPQNSGPRAGHPVEQREAGHAQSGHPVAGRPEQHVLLHLRQGLSSRRRQSVDPVRSHLSEPHARMHPGLPQPRPVTRRAGHLQVRFGAELRGGRQEQHRQSRSPGQQRLLHQVEQHPGKCGAAHLPDPIHRKPRQRRLEGVRPAGRFPGDRRILHRVELWLYGCALHHEHLLSDRCKPDCRWWWPAMRSRDRTASGPATRFRRTRYHSAWNTSSSAFAHESFVRGDWEYLAGDKWLHAAQDPNTSSYDPTGLPTAAGEFRLAARRHQVRRLGRYRCSWTI